MNLIVINKIKTLLLYLKKPKMIYVFFVIILILSILYLLHTFISINKYKTNWQGKWKLQIDFSIDDTFTINFPNLYNSVALCDLKVSENINAKFKGTLSNDTLLVFNLNPDEQKYCKIKIWTDKKNYSKLQHIGSYYNLKGNSFKFNLINKISK